MAITYRCEIKQHGHFDKPECPVCNKKASICSHRTMIKVLLNPLLRLFGVQIVSIFTEDDKFVMYSIRSVKL